MPFHVRDALPALPLLGAFALLAACQRDPTWGPASQGQGAPPPNQGYGYGQPNQGYGQPPPQGYNQPPPQGYNQPPRQQPPAYGRPPIPAPAKTGAQPTTTTLPPNTSVLALDANANAMIAALNKYRAAHNLPAITGSRSMSMVAKAHVNDLEKNNPSGSCILHSWSAGGPWSSCCYTADGAKAQCMWSKPKEIAGFAGNGYEIAAGGLNLSPDESVQLWDSDAPHRTVMLNQGDWTAPWGSVGGYSSAHYAVMWFANESDPVH